MSANIANLSVVLLHFIALLTFTRSELKLAVNLIQSYAKMLLTGALLIFCFSFLFPE
jgi:hypothetical protein